MLKKLLILTCLVSNLHAIQTIAELDAPIKHLCHDKATDSFFAGLDAGGGIRALCQIKKNGSVVPLAIDKKLKDRAVVGCALLENAVAVAFAGMPSELVVVPRDEPAKIKKQKVLDARDTEVAAITHLATSGTHIFARVLSRSGDADGIAVLEYDGQELCHISTTALDAQSPCAPGTLQSLQVNDLYWDDELHRLYIALDIEVAPGIGNTGYAILVGQLGGSGVLSLAPITSALPKENSVHAHVAYTSGLAPQRVFDREALDYVSADDLPAMLTDAALENNTSTQARINITGVRTMHTSTGLRYLVFSGGVQQMSYQRMDLVREGGLVRIQPTVITVKSNAAGEVFVLPLGSKHTPQAGQLVATEVSQNEQRSSSLYATPLHQHFAFTQKPIATEESAVLGLVACSDGVYFATQDGVYGRQPSFGVAGEITGWHEQARVFPKGEEVGSTFAVSARDGKVTCARDGKLVQQQWERDADKSVTLAKMVCEILPDGVYAIYEGSDLYFGGTGRIVRVTDETVIGTDVPGAGAVLCLGEAAGRMYAGCQNGLWTLQSDAWEQVPEVQGEVASITSSVSKERALALVKDETLVDKLYLIGGEVVQIAALGQMGLPSNVIATGATLLGESYGVLATSNGLYVSSENFEEWSLVSGTAGLAFTSLHSHGNGRTPLWGVVATNDGLDFPNRFARSRIVQFGGGINEQGNFEVRVLTTGGHQAPIHGVYSDGGRRFALMEETDETDLLMGLRSLPYNLVSWGLEGPARDPGLSGFSRMHCIANLRTRC